MTRRNDHVADFSHARRVPVIHPGERCGPRRDVPILKRMDVNTSPDFVESYALIRARYGSEWAKRFVLVAPLVLGDPDGQVRRAFVDGLTARHRGDVASAEQAWATCQWLVRDAAARLVREAERILTTA